MTIGVRIEDFVDPEPSGLAPVCVLIVGDDAANRRALREIVAPLRYAVVEAASGTEARDFVARQDFAVILVDIRAPGADGFETAAFIRSREVATLTPIVFLTASERVDDDMAIGNALGAVDFIVVPVVPSALRSKVSLFADLFTKNQQLAERATRLRIAANRSSDALSFQLVMLDRMETLARNRTDFVSKISHELRSPLTAVIGYVELLIDGVPGALNAEQSRMLTIIDRNSMRLMGLIEDLLTVSRVEAGIFELEVGPVDLARIVDDVVETTAPAATKAEVKVTVTLGSDLALIGDEGQLERALLNLVSNAIKFNVPNGVVEITTRVDDGDLVVAVRDTGTGVPQAEQEHLFTRFFRAMSSRDHDVPGTGLGLYIVKQIVELHGGAIEVESSPAGSTFSMLLPVGGPPADPLALVRRG